MFMLDSSAPSTEQVAPRTDWETLFETRCAKVHERIDGILKKLLLVQWALLVPIAYLFTPSTWTGAERALHPHVLTALIGGGLLALFPIWLMARAKGTMLSHCVTAAAQLGHSSLLILAMSGRVEAHFHLFVSLAFIAAYRQSKPLIVATAVAAIDHIIRGIWFPSTIFGADSGSFLRVGEHLVYALFEVGVLTVTMRMSLEETRSSARTQAEAEAMAVQHQEQQVALVQEAVGRFIREKVSHALRGIQEMASSIQMNAVSAGELATHSNSNGEIAKDGNERMIAMMGEVQGLVSSIDDSREQLGTLKASSEHIRNATKLIEDLAFQTNLLALNAAVEAARAGEYGSGFAVVAEEVRALAGRTSAAVLEIDEMTRSISDETSHVIDSITEASQRAEASLGVASEASARLATVERSSEEMAELVSSVAAATEEQSVTSRQLAELVEGISDYRGAA